MQCRKANNGDANSLGALGICVWVDTYASDGVTPSIAGYVLREFAPDKMAELIDEKHVYVVEQSGISVGYAVLSEGINGTEVQNIYILPRFQALGLGTKLLGHVMKRHGKVWLSCWAKNEKALRFYASRGFVRTGTTTFDLDGESHLNYIMEGGT